LNGIFTHNHFEPQFYYDVFSLTGGDVIAPGAAGVIIYLKPLQTVGVKGLGVALVHQPGPAVGEHNPAIFRDIRIEVGGQQAVIAAGQPAPGYWYPQHPTPSIGIDKGQVSAEQFRPLKNSFYPGIGGFRQGQHRSIGMAVAVRFKNRQFESIGPGGLRRCLW